MASTQLCESGCGRPYFLEIGTAGDPIHSFYCAEHGISWFLEMLNAMEAAQLAAEGAEPGTAAEGRSALAGRSRRRGPRPRPVAVDDDDGPVVEDSPAEDAPATAAGEQ